MKFSQRILTGLLLLLGLLGNVIAYPVWGETKVPEINRIVNGGFESGLTGWKVEGAIHNAEVMPLEGISSLAIGPGIGAVRQQYRVAGLQVVLFSARWKADAPPEGACIRAQCYDAQNHLVMDLKEPLESGKEGNLSGSKGIYFKTHAKTAYLMVSIEKTSERGILYADAAELKDNDRGRKIYASQCNLDDYLLPFWKSRTIYRETVLLFSKAGELPHGTLLYAPDRILALCDYSLKNAYEEKRDYTLNGNTITATRSTRLPFLKDSDLPTTTFPWLELPARQIVVTYTHQDTWTGPVPAFQGDNLPRTLQRLRRRQPLVIVATGDSITLGTGTSGNDRVPPYMPTWGELFVHRLKRVYAGQDIQFYNTALGGMTSQWGRDNVDSAVASLHPNLVIIAYGMNDFWWMSPDDFKKNVQAMIARVRVDQPDAEFILISSMLFDPAYTDDTPYREHLLGYADALHTLAGKGVSVLDMTAITSTLFDRKQAKSVLHDPLHPNDYLARWYAQGLVALLEDTAVHK